MRRLPPKQAVDRLRKICMSLPGAHEKLSHGEPTWFAGKVFAMLSDHHHDDRLAFWCAAPAGAQDALVTADPRRFFRPKYVGGQGWIGVYLDVEQDWDEIAELVEDSFRLVARKTAVIKLDERLPGNTEADKKRLYAKLRKICAALPEVAEKPFGGHWTPAWRVDDRIFCGTGQTGRARMTVKGARGAQQALVASDPERFFVPPYTGPKGWVGVWLDADPDWDEIAELVEESYRQIAPRKLVARLDRMRGARART